MTFSQIRNKRKSVVATYAHTAPPIDPTAIRDHRTPNRNAKIPPNLRYRVGNTPRTSHR
ncbi:hypothetical protein LOAG_17856 [Loa loa]|uniref:Uncharacterized protein n=1 Tax=Loa loa TaxID=7209 RepID=A0A1S0UHK1_LOALO|nr:hypothetical protein LOAG_17856 [Loa loa]EJD74906.1 hypothetical protein LOAG_17856 [Loa loa]